MRTRLFWLDSLSKHLIRQGLHKHLYTRTYLSVDGRTDGRTVCDYIINLLWSYIPFMVHEEKKFRLEMSSVTCQILVLLFVTHFSHIFEKILWVLCHQSNHRNCIPHCNGVSSIEKFCSAFFFQYWCVISVTQMPN